MAKIYGALEVAQLEWFTNAGKPAASSYAYRVIYVTDLKEVQVSDGSSWIQFANLSEAQTFAGNKTFSGQLNVSGSRNITVTTDSSTSGAINDYSNTTPALELTNAGVTSISGFANSQSGRLLILVNRTGVSISILDEGSGSTAANRIRTGTGAPVSLANNASTTFIYMSDSRWHMISGTGAGSSSGTNFITNGTAEADTSGWATYADAAGSSPVDGTGGSPTVTWTRTTTTPLVGTASFLFTKDASNRQGQGASFDFTIDSAYQAKVLQISFEYQVASGTFSAGSSSTDSDITVWIYDITNAQLIQPTTYKLFASTTGVSTTFISNFQTSSNSTSYRLILHCASTSASAYTVEFDNIVVAPSSYVYGSPISDWQSYGSTASYTGFGTVSSNTQMYRRVGSNLEIRARFTAGTTTATEARLAFPSGLTSSSTAITTLENAGTLIKDSGSSTTTFGFYCLMEPSVSYITFGYSISIAAPLAKQNGNNLASSGQVISIQASVPIQGWASNVQMSDQADSRIVLARATGAPTGGSGAASTLIWPTVSFDTHSAYNSSTGEYTAPISGYYRVGAEVNGTNAGIVIRAYIDGVLDVDMALTPSGTSAGVVNGSTIVKVTAGQKITVRTSASIGALASGGFVSFEKIQSPTIISATETIAASYWLSSNFSTSTTTPINFDSKEIDTHSAVTTSATAWKFTAPVSGTYQVSTSVFNTSSTQGFSIYKNGTAYKGVGVGNNTQTVVANSTVLMKLNAGEYIDIRTDAGTMTVAGGALTAFGTGKFNILRVGN